ncbi:MAG: hypothetical protein R3E13_03545 [Alphaproteobacteria bacterium]
MKLLLEQIEAKLRGAPGDDEFAMWRAVLAMVHVDDDIAALEDYLVGSVTQIFQFSDEQKGRLAKDMEERPSPKDLFGAIESEACRAQFFRLARVIAWCDGVLHEDELNVVEEIKDALGDEVQAYESDLRWMHRKPDLPMGTSAGSSEEEMMMHIMFQMMAFYEQRERDVL